MAEVLFSFLFIFYMCIYSCSRTICWISFWFLSWWKIMIFIVSEQNHDSCFIIFIVDFMDSPITFLAFTKSIFLWESLQMGHMEPCYPPYLLHTPSYTDGHGIHGLVGSGVLYNSELEQNYRRFGSPALFLSGSAGISLGVFKKKAPDWVMFRNWRQGRK